MCRGGAAWKVVRQKTKMDEERNCRAAKLVAAANGVAAKYHLVPMRGTWEIGSIRRPTFDPNQEKAAVGTDTAIEKQQSRWDRNYSSRWQVHRISLGARVMIHLHESSLSLSSLRG